MKRLRPTPWLALLLLCGCAGDLAVRAAVDRSPDAGGALAALPPLEIRVAPVQDAPPGELPVGRRANGLLQPGGPIHLTEDVAGVTRRLVTGVLRATGHRTVEQGGQVSLVPRVLRFRVDAPRKGAGWEVIASVEIALLIARNPGDAAWEEFVLTAERRADHPAQPGVSTVERVLGECLRDLAELLARREPLAAALRRFAAGG